MHIRWIEIVDMRTCDCSFASHEQENEIKNLEEAIGCTCKSCICVEKGGCSLNCHGFVPFKSPSCLSKHSGEMAGRIEAFLEMGEDCLPYCNVPTDPESAPSRVDFGNGVDFTSSLGAFSKGMFQSSPSGLRRSVDGQSRPLVSYGSYLFSD